MGMVLLTSKQVAARLGMTTQALRVAGYRGYLPFKPLTPDITGRRSLLYVESEVNEHLQSLVAKREIRLAATGNAMGCIPAGLRRQ